MRDFDPALIMIGGVHPSPPDDRDHPFPATEAPTVLPVKAEVSTPPDIRNQQDWGSCACQTGAKIATHEYTKAGLPFVSSACFAYGYIRGQDGQACQNVGTDPRQISDMHLKVGSVPEALWPEHAGGLCRVPTAAELSVAATHKVDEYTVCGSLDLIKAAIAADHKVHICLFLKANFREALSNGGRVPMPAGDWWTPGNMDESGHDMAARACDDTTQFVTVENHWTEQVGDNGLFYLPYAMFDLPPEQGGVWLSNAFALHVNRQQPPPPAPEKVAVTAIFPTTGVVGQAVPMSATATGQRNPVTFQWTFSDGTSGTGPNVTHAYQAAGNYAVSVQAMDIVTGATSQATGVVSIAPAPAPPPTDCHSRALAIVDRDIATLQVLGAGYAYYVAILQWTRAHLAAGIS